MSWMKNATVAAAGSGCSIPCTGRGRIDPRSRVPGYLLGRIQRRAQPARAALAGQRLHGDLPRTVGRKRRRLIFKRLQIAETDLDPGVGLYFIEGPLRRPRRRRRR